MTLAQIDGQAPFEVIYDLQPLEKTEPLSKNRYQPRGSTPLLDAMGRGILTLAAQLAQEPLESKAQKVIFMTITDGMENASHEFSRKQVQNLIKEKSEKAQWQFVCLSSDLSAIAEAQGLGVTQDKRRYFEKNQAGVQAAFRDSARESLRYRQKDSHNFSLDDDKDD